MGRCGHQCPESIGHKHIGVEFTFELGRYCEGFFYHQAFVFRFGMVAIQLKGELKHHPKQEGHPNT